MKVQARLNNYRKPARKVREVVPIIKGLDVAEAEWQLENLKKGCAQDLKKLLLSAVSNAQNNHGLDKDNLFVSEMVAQEGRTLKRWRPRAYGRAAPILKRSCHVVLSIEEKEEGKGRKKVGQATEKVEEKTEKQTGTKSTRDEKEGEEKKDQGETKDEQVKAKGKPAMKDSKNIKSTATKKIFRRKSF